MKRYDILEYNPETQNECDPVESPTGKWVKYEPWMDETEPTICAICENYDDIVMINHVPVQSPDYSKCLIKKLDFVTGDQTICSCYEKNHGNCPDYKPKG